MKRIVITESRDTKKFKRVRRVHNRKHLAQVPRKTINKHLPWQKRTFLYFRNIMYILYRITAAMKAYNVINNLRILSTSQFRAQSITQPHRLCFVIQRMDGRDAVSNAGCSLQLLLKCQEDTKKRRLHCTRLAWPDKKSCMSCNLRGSRSH